MPIAGDNAASTGSIRETIVHVGEADVIVPYAKDSKTRRFVRRVGSQGFTTVLNILFGLDIRYYNSSVFRRSLLDTIAIKSNGYAFIAETCVKLIKRGATYVQVGIDYPATANDYSSALRPKNLIKVFKDIVRLAWDVWFSAGRPTRAVSERPTMP